MGDNRAVSRVVGERAGTAGIAIGQGRDFGNFGRCKLSGVRRGS